MPTVQQLILFILENYHLRLSERHAEVILEHIDEAEHVAIIGQDVVSGQRKTISVPAETIRGLRAGENAP